MAAKKELFNVKGVNLTAHEKKVYDAVKTMGVVNYSEIASACDISTKSAVATLARLEKTHGLLKKNEPVKISTYELSE